MLDTTNIRQQLRELSSDTLMMFGYSDIKEAQSIKSLVYYYGRVDPRTDGNKYSVSIDQRIKVVKVKLKAEKPQL